MSKMFLIIIAHGCQVFFQDLDRKGPSLMSIDSNATANGYNITYKSGKKKKEELGL